MDGPTSTYTPPSVKNQGIGRVSDKPKISVWWKTKAKLANASALQHYTTGFNTFEHVELPSSHCFRTLDALDPRLCLLHNVRYWLTKTLEELLEDTARKYGCEYCLTNIARACNFYHSCVKCDLSYIKSRISDERMWYSPYTFYQHQQRC